MSQHVPLNIRGVNFRGKETPLEWHQKVDLPDLNLLIVDYQRRHKECVRVVLDIALTPLGVINSVP